MPMVFGVAKETDGTTDSSIALPSLPALPNFMLLPFFTYVFLFICAPNMHDARTIQVFYSSSVGLCNSHKYTHASRMCMCVRVNNASLRNGE